MPSPALGSEAQPAVDESMLSEPGGAELAGPWAGEEERLELRLVEVAVLVERGQDGEVPGRQASEQVLSLGWRRDCSRFRPAVGDKVGDRLRGGTVLE